MNLERYFCGVASIFRKSVYTHLTVYMLSLSSYGSIAHIPSILNYYFYFSFSRYINFVMYLDIIHI
jgi:hypothetical protein